MAVRPLDPPKIGSDRSAGKDTSTGPTANRGPLPAGAKWGPLQGPADGGSRVTLLV